MDWVEKWNGNIQAKTPSGSSLLLYRVKDDYGTPLDDQWKWIATRHDDYKVFSKDTFTSLEMARRDILDKIRIGE